MAYIVSPYPQDDPRYVQHLTSDGANYVYADQATSVSSTSNIGQRQGIVGSVGGVDINAETMTADTLRHYVNSMGDVYGFSMEEDKLKQVKKAYKKLPKEVIDLVA